MGSRIWLIGGTQESACLARAIVQEQIPCLVSVTTESARKLYPTPGDLQIWVGNISPEKMPQFLQSHGIVGILDASHPFATVVSQGAIAAAQTSNIPYLRYERKRYEQETGSGLTDGQGAGGAEPGKTGFREDLEAPGVVYRAAVGFPLSELEIRFPTLFPNPRILLILGYRSLPLFQDWHDRTLLFARILPSIPALEGALAAGFGAERLIALRPPVSEDLERALWQQWAISLVIAKASGVPGGEGVKRAIAAELNLPLVLIERPPLAYPRQTSAVTEAIDFCHQVMANRS